mgnify:CR=1 FL=1
MALAVNIIELICSAGLPAIYTHVLSLHKLPQISYYGCLVLYIRVFMAYDFLSFLVAMTTLHAIKIQYTYAQISRLIASVALFLLKILWIFKPAYLMFS